LQNILSNTPIESGTSFTGRVSEELRRGIKLIYVLKEVLKVNLNLKTGIVDQSETETRRCTRELSGLGKETRRQ
jgi:hypothetical protein